MDLIWLENKIFVAVYGGKTESEEDIPRTLVFSLTQSSAPKKTNYCQLDDPCFSSEAGFYYFSDVIRSWYIS
jgi:hypothetical protein